MTDLHQAAAAAPPSTETESTTIPDYAAAIAGLVAAAIALASGELIAALVAPQPSPVVGVAARVIDYAPEWFVEFGKSIFGVSDKPALIIGTIILASLFASGLGVIARTRFGLAAAGFGLFGLLGAWAMASDAQGSLLASLLTALIATGLGIATLSFLLNRARRSATDRSVPAFGSPTNPPVSRRGFLGWAGAGGVAAAALATTGKGVRARSKVDEARQAVVMEPSEASEAVEELVQAASSGDVATTEGITPLVIEADDFYLIDTAIIKPQVDPDTWQLRIHGLVDQEVTYTYQELLDRATTVAPVTLSCVSNEVGGGLVGNAIWRGVPLSDLLEEAGVQTGASQIASRSVDGWECGFPTEAAFDGRTALVAVAMNDEPLTIAHGFPVRLVVSGLYGYVSATKWLKEIELTTWEDFDGFWIPRGWAKSGPVKTQSRIDTPNRRKRAVAGPVAVAGVAWAPNIGIERVEVQVDDGPWEEAALGEGLGDDAWAQWLYNWQATPGPHTIRCRATDKSGYTQTSDIRPPAPDGASGWHRVSLSVDEA